MIDKSDMLEIIEGKIKTAIKYDIHTDYLVFHHFQELTPRLTQIYGVMKVPMYHVLLNGDLLCSTVTFDPPDGKYVNVNSNGKLRNEN